MASQLCTKTYHGGALFSALRGVIRVDHHSADKIIHKPCVVMVRCKHERCVAPRIVMVPVDRSVLKHDIHSSLCKVG
jgi:hypothetical protein